MTKIIAFNSPLYKFNIFEDGLEILKSWVISAQEELEKSEVISHQSCNLDKGKEDGGTLWSTFETPAKSFFSFPESNKLLSWVKQKAVEIAPDLGFINCQSVDLNIDWMNIMYENSFGNCHTHHDINELDTKRKIVAIFYLQAPSNSAKLLAIKNTKDYSSMGVSPFTIADDEIIPIDVNTGDLIIHKTDMPHAISKHNNIEPRICLVMEFSFNE